jgi:hypothetical protein
MTPARNPVLDRPAAGWSPRGATACVVAALIAICGPVLVLLAAVTRKP